VDDLVVGIEVTEIRATWCRDDETGSPIASDNAAPAVAEQPVSGEAKELEEGKPRKPNPIQEGEFQAQVFDWDVEGHCATRVRELVEDADLGTRKSAGELLDHTAHRGLVAAIVAVLVGNDDTDGRCRRGQNETGNNIEVSA
jgi:hypothetical protein